MIVESKQTNEKLIETKISKHGVFTLVKDETGVRLVIQNQLVSDKIFKTYEDAEKYISKKPYELILISSHIYNATINKMLEQQKNHQRETVGTDGDTSNNN